MFGGMIKKAKDIAPNEFEHSREYLPIKLIQGATQDLLLDAMAGIFHKAAELHCASMSCEPPNLITTNERRQILADRKEAEKLEKERIEREAASEELKMVSPHPKAPPPQPRHPIPAQMWDAHHAGHGRCQGLTRRRRPD